MNLVACISGKTASGCIREAEGAEKEGASLIELRIDYLADRSDVLPIIEACTIPVIATFRRKNNGGIFEGDEAQRIDALKSAIRAGAKYVDIEMDADSRGLEDIRQVAAENNCKVIVSQHDFTGTPCMETMVLWLEKCAKLGDIVKIVPAANSMDDCMRALELLEVAHQKKIPLVAFAMGEKGKFTRAVSPFFGSLWTYCATTKALGPGQMSLSDMKKIIKVLS